LNFFVEIVDVSLDVCVGVECAIRHSPSKSDIHVLNIKGRSYNPLKILNDLN
jgi:hypothetical protein